MKQITFVTTNQGKVNSLKSALTEFGIKVVHKPLELPEIRSEKVGDIAAGKVMYAFEKLKRPVIVNDSGFFIHSLNGFPQTFVNFALETIGIDGMMKLVEGKKRQCEFRSCLAYMDGTLQKPMLFEDKVEGVLADRIHKGKKRDYFWSDLFFIFIPKGKSITLSQMSKEKYFLWRTHLHKNSYLIQFAEWFLKHK